MLALFPQKSQIVTDLRAGLIEPVAPWTPITLLQKARATEKHCWPLSLPSSGHC